MKDFLTSHLLLVANNSDARKLKKQNMCSFKGIFNNKYMEVYAHINNAFCRHAYGFALFSGCGQSHGHS